MLQPEASPAPTLSSRVSGGLAAGVAISSVVVAAVAFIVVYLYLRKDKIPDVEALKGPQQKNWQSHPRPSSPSSSSPIIINSRGSSGFNYSGSENSLAPAPYSCSIPLGFSQSNVSQELPNGIGYVHSQQVISNGNEQAGELESQAEVEIITGVHQDLVGYCTPHSQRHEFGELHLLGNSKIIPLQSKAPNLLLDQKFETNVADFSPAKLFTNTNTHVSTRVMGTIRLESQPKVEIITRVHQDLVRYRTTRSQRHEFVPNNKLEFHFHGNSKIIPPETKAPNLLLDQKVESKVTDLRLAKLSSNNINTHVSTCVKGTFGSGASKYPSSGCLEAYKRLNWTKFQSHYIAWAFKIQPKNLPKAQFPNFNLPKHRTFAPPQSPPPLPAFLRKNLPEIFCCHSLHHLLRLHRKTYPKTLRRHNSHHLRRSSAIQLRRNHYSANPNRNAAAMAMARALRFVGALPPCKFLRL